MPTAYLSPSQLRELTDVSVNPGAPQDGYPLVWNNSTGKWEASSTFTGTLTGSATSLATGRTISATGDISWTSGAFDGTANVTGVATLATLQGLSPGTYTNANLTVDGKGRVTAVSSGADIDPEVTLPLATNNGGTGTQTGSITGTGALTFASSANGNVSLSPQGTGKAVIGNELDVNLRSQDGTETGLNVILPNNQGNGSNGIYLRKGDAYFGLVNGTSVGNSFFSTFLARNNPSQSNQTSCMDFLAGYPATALPLSGVTAFRVRDSNFSTALLPDNVLCFGFWNGNQSVGAAGDPNFNSNSLLFNIMGNGNAAFRGELRIRSTSASTSTTTGALQVSGGIGAQGNLIVGGTRINYANLPTSSTAPGVQVGDLWRDGDVVKVKL